MTSKPLVSRTLATLRNAEFGFFGVVVYTRVQTPRFCGEACSAGTVLRDLSGCRGLAISWLIVGILLAFATLVWAFAPGIVQGSQSVSFSRALCSPTAFWVGPVFPRDFSARENEMAPSAWKCGGVLPFGRPQSGKAPRPFSLTVSVRGSV